MTQETHQDLAHFLADRAKPPLDFGYGRSDCLLTLADWVLNVRGFDPAEAFRGSYASQAEAEAIIAAHGGMATLIAAAIDGRLAATDTPSAGDIGVVLVPTLQGRAEAGAIFCGQRWAVPRTGGGHCLLTADAVAVWQVGA